MPKGSGPPTVNKNHRWPGGGAPTANKTPDREYKKVKAQEFENIVPQGFFDVVDSDAKIKSDYSTPHKLKLEQYYAKFFEELTKKEVNFLHKIITHGEIEVINRNIDNLSKKHLDLATRYREIVSRAKLPTTIHVWRGGPPLAQPYNNPEDLYAPTADFSVGSEVASRHFLSTSLDPVIAWSYRGSSDWLYQLIIPKGTPAIYFGEFLEGGNPEDLEVTLLANVKIKIIAVEKIKRLKLVFAQVTK